MADLVGELGVIDDGGVNVVGEAVSVPLVNEVGEVSSMLVNVVDEISAPLNVVGEDSSPLVGACSYNPLDGSLERFLKLRARSQEGQAGYFVNEGERDQPLIPGAAARRISDLVTDLEKAKSERDGYRSEIESFKAMVAELQNTPGRKHGSASVLEVVSEKHEAKTGFSTPITSSKGSLLYSNGGKSPGSNSSSRSWADKVEEEEEEHGAMQVPVPALRAGCIYGSHGYGPRRGEGHALPARLQQQNSTLPGAARQQQQQSSLPGQ